MVENVFFPFFSPRVINFFLFWLLILNDLKGWWPQISAWKAIVSTLMTKATKLKWEEGEEAESRRQDRGREVNGLIKRSGSRGLRVTHASPVCRLSQGQVCQVSQQDCWLKKTLFLSDSPSADYTPLVYLPCSLSTLPSSHWFSLCRLSRSLFKISIRIGFYTTASGGMYSLFGIVWQTDGGFHATFMRLSEHSNRKSIFLYAATVSLCIPSFFFLIPPFFAGLGLGQAHTGDESELESRRVCVTYNYFPRRARRHRAQSKREERSSLSTFAAWTCLTLIEEC